MFSNACRMKCSINRSVELMLKHSLPFLHLFYNGHIHYVMLLNMLLLFFLFPEHWLGYMITFFKSLADESSDLFLLD